MVLFWRQCKKVQAQASTCTCCSDKSGQDSSCTYWDLLKVDWHAARHHFQTARLFHLTLLNLNHIKPTKVNSVQDTWVHFLVGILCIVEMCIVVMWIVWNCWNVDCVEFCIVEMWIVVMWIVWKCALWIVWIVYCGNVYCGNVDYVELCIVEMWRLCWLASCSAQLTDTSWKKSSSKQRSVARFSDTLPYNFFCRNSLHAGTKYIFGYLDWHQAA